MPAKIPSPADDAGLRKQAEDQLRAEGPPTTEDDPRRILHELQVHQIELELQNEELRDARSRLEEMVEKYTDLYDFAPVSYFSLDVTGRIERVNLPGAAMLRVERSNLLRRQFSSFVAREYHSDLKSFLRNVFQGSSTQVCELALDIGTKDVIWVDLQGMQHVSSADGQLRCRLAVSDITTKKLAVGALHRAEVLESMNTKLQEEVSRRKAAEKSLRKSKKNLDTSIKEARRIAKVMRLLTHKTIRAQEDERKRISHELHDEVAQTLIAINIHLDSLAQGADLHPGEIAEKIVATQKLVETSVENVHRFAMELRPAHLDNLGLVPALREYLKEFEKTTKVPVYFTAPPVMQPLGDNLPVVLYRVAQAALANVAKHAKATQVEVVVKQTKRYLLMELKNNGVSFPVNETLNKVTFNRLGLIGMKERVEMVGGKFTVTSSPGKGTTISVRIANSKIAEAAVTTDPKIDP